MAEQKTSWVTDEDIAFSNQKLEDAKKDFAAGKYRNAMAYCRTALRVNPDSAKEVKLLMGKICLETGKLSSHWDFNDSIAASDYFDEVVELDPNCAEAYLYSGISIVHWGNNYEAAKKRFDKALELDPDNELAARYRALCEKCLNSACNGKKIDRDKLDGKSYNRTVKYLTKILTKQYSEAQKDLDELLELMGSKRHFSLVANNLSVYLHYLRY